VRQNRRSKYSNKHV